MRLDVMQQMLSPTGAVPADATYEEIGVLVRAPRLGDYTLTAVELLVKLSSTFGLYVVDDTAIVCNIFIQATTTVYLCAARR